MISRSATRLTLAGLPTIQLRTSERDMRRKAAQLAWDVCSQAHAKIAFQPMRDDPRLRAPDSVLECALAACCGIVVAGP